MKLALIGGGYWGKNLIREFNNCGVLHTICEIDDLAIEKYNKEYPHVLCTKNWDDVLANTEIDSVCVSLPAEMHYSFAKKALLAGKHVYIEKPITLNTEEGENLVSLAKIQDLTLMVGHLLHYHPCVQKMKEILASGELGNIKFITSNRQSLGIFRTQENVLWSFAPHDISVALSLISPNSDILPTNIKCTGGCNVTKGVEDIVNLSFCLNNVYVNINLNWLNPIKEQKMTIVCEKGIIVFDDVAPSQEKLKIYGEYVKYPESGSLNMNPIPIKTDPKCVTVDLTESPLLKECKYFVECVNTHSVPITNGDEGLRVLKVLNLAQCELDKSNKQVQTQTQTQTQVETKLKYYAHPTAIIDDGAEIGEGTKIWHFTHVCKGAVIGKNCNIGQNCFVAGGSILGDNCKVQNNVSIYAGVTCEDNVFLGPSCVLTNDLNPRCEHPKGGHYVSTYIERCATIGANATIVCGHRIGHHALVGAGCTVSKNVDPYAIVVGNPCKSIGTIDEFGNRSLKK